MKQLLRFITCGSVDDGKSTLIGHMLYDAKLIFADQEQALMMDSKAGSNDGELDYSLLLDGLMAEREQGITIDVAYRYFTTQKRSFIVADTPGHIEYTRNMAVGASFADLAVILTDAFRGVQEQTKRHIRICSMMGIRHFVVAINKMDLVDYAQPVFEEMKKQITAIMDEFPYKSLQFVPVSATVGDNVTTTSLNMPWYRGTTLLSHLESIEIVGFDGQRADFFMPVQRVCRPNHTFRGFQGQIGRGEVRCGDEVTVLPSKERAVVQKIYILDKEASAAQEGMPATLVLDREVDVSRGCIIMRELVCSHSNIFRVQLLWLDERELFAGREYILRLATETVAATVNKIGFMVDIHTGTHLSARGIHKNEIAVCEIETTKKILLDSFEKTPELGRFLLIDRVTNQTAACGVILHPMRRADNLTWQKTEITREIRSKRLGQEPLTLWFTGLSGSGKSTLADMAEKKLVEKGRYTMLLDGDNIRLGLNGDLGFTEADRIENIRRTAEVAKLLNDAGLIVMVAFISPYERDRQMARSIIGESFREIYVSTPIEECRRRDVKGLYKKAERGEITNFTGVNSPYEIPACPDMTIDTTGADVERLARDIIKKFFKFD